MASFKDKMLFGLGGVFLVVLVGLLIFDISRRGVYSGRMGINIAVVGDNGVSLLLLRPEEGMVQWVKLPDGIRVKVYNSSAVYPLESLWSFGVLEKKPFKMIEKSLGQSMGIIVSRTIKVEDSSVIENVLGKMFSLGLKTDLSIRDRFLIRNFLAETVKSKKVLELTVPKNVFDEVTDLDGKSFVEFNLSTSLWTKNKFVFEPLLDENAYISINNISGVSGAGGILANQLESSGMHVIELKGDSSESVSGDGCVYSTERHYPFTELVLIEQVGCKKIPKPEFVEVDEKIRIWVKDLN